jgi:uncharacterized membrane protein YphA (DoxX/SURF4 family)
MEKVLAFLGRVIYSLPFLGFGVNHLMNAGKMAGMVPSMFPGGVFWIYFTGVAMILGALAIITGKQGRNACFGLALMLLVFIMTMHLPSLSNPQMQMMAMVNLLKDTGLLGGALVIAGTFKSKS